MKLEFELKDEIIQKAFEKHIYQEYWINECIKEGMEKQKEIILDFIKQNIEKILFDEKTIELLRERIVNLLARNIVESKNFWINNIIDASVDEIKKTSYIDKVVEQIIKKTVNIVKKGEIL